jgi:hypothetical protein
VIHKLRWIKIEHFSSYLARGSQFNRNALHQLDAGSALHYALPKVLDADANGGDNSETGYDYTLFSHCDNFSLAKSNQKGPTPEGRPRSEQYSGKRLLKTDF